MKPVALSNQAHRQLIGYLGLFLPLFLWVFAGIRPTTNLAPWKLLDSVSAYYYTGATGIFTGVLFALALFLATYQGYDGVRVDRVVGRIGGFAAIGVALFPTTAPHDSLRLSWWSDATRVTHYVSAITLFVCFILFAIWLFRRSSITAHSARPAAKQRRDTICLWCGIVMIGAVLWAASAIFTHGRIFWPETVAIGAFAVSWLVKGEAPQTAIDAFKAGMAKLRA